MALLSCDAKFLRRGQSGRFQWERPVFFGWLFVAGCWLSIAFGSSRTAAASSFPLTTNHQQLTLQ
jgi:hypothetical protein